MVQSKPTTKILLCYVVAYIIFAYALMYNRAKGKEYSLNIRTRQCNVTNLTRPFRPYGVPPFANFSGEASIGATGVPGESVVIEHFTGKFEDGTYFFGDVTYPDCFPVNRGAFNNEMGFVMETFFDINIGIADPSVFIPPSECAGR